MASPLEDDEQLSTDDDDPSVDYAFVVEALAKEKQKLATARPEGSWVKFQGILSWYLFFPGPADSLYSGYNFRVKADFPTSYPQNPPTCYFDPPIYHPNVNPNTGEICYSMLKSGGWNPDYGVSRIISLLKGSFVKEPNPHSPLNQEAANLLLKNPNAYRDRIESERIDHQFVRGQPDKRSLRKVQITRVESPSESPSESPLISPRRSLDTSTNNTTSVATVAPPILNNNLQ